jgi:hypothetical protein
MPETEIRARRWSTARSGRYEAIDRDQAATRRPKRGVAVVQGVAGHGVDRDGGQGWGSGRASDSLSEKMKTESRQQLGRAKLIE